MKRELVVIPRVTVNPGQITTFSEYHYTPGKPSRDHCMSEDSYNRKVDHILNSARSAQGNVSKIAKRKIERCVDYALTITPQKIAHNPITGRPLKYQITFVTLTLPSTQFLSVEEIHEKYSYLIEDVESNIVSIDDLNLELYRHQDTEIINTCLNQFLIELKRYHHVKNYIWRAEKQANGNIHFHIVIDQYIFFQTIRDRWNRIIEKLKYITRYRIEQEKFHRAGFKVRESLLPTWSLDRQREAYNRGVKSHWNSPNTTDIHSLKKIRNVKSYLAKYITKKSGTHEKNSQYESVVLQQTGRIWGCNRELGSAKGASLCIDTEIEYELTKLNENRSIRTYHDTYFSVYYVKFSELKELECNRLFSALALYMYNHFDIPEQLTQKIP